MKIPNQEFSNKMFSVQDNIKFSSAGHDITIIKLGTVAYSHARGCVNAEQQGVNTHLYMPSYFEPC